ncbi:MAG: Wadjet anti-phage system protein JetD domain-containing protein [Tetrasphaera sp.]
MSPRAPRGWTTSADIAARVRRRWDDGSLLTAYAAGAPCPRVEVPIRGPAVREIGAELAAVREWSARLVRDSGEGAAYGLTLREVGGRAIGRNTIPARAGVESFEQAWRLLGVGAQVARFDAVREVTASREPRLVGWVARNPLRALAVADEWPRLVAAVAWLAGNGGRGWYVRQITAAGVDTKFVAAHRGLIAALLDELLATDPAAPADHIDQSRSRGAGFAARYSFAEPEPLVHVRVDAGFAGLPPPVTEAAFRLDELARLRTSARRVVIVENQVTYLAVPVPAEGVVVWGAGFSAGRLGRVPWIRAAASVIYSGDIDTHGFAILSLLRAGVPHASSLLMDRDTLLAHRDRWGHEPSPTRARLDRLTDIEQVLYQELVEDVHGSAVRLEQERIAWDWVEQELTGLRWGWG